MLSVRFQQCFDQFTMLLIESFSETGLFRHLSNHVFRSPQVQKYISYEGYLLFENVQNWISISKLRIRKLEKIFRFWDNCIWKCCNKLALFWREYLSPAVNVLRNSSKILHITKRELFQLNCVPRNWGIWQRSSRSDLNSVLARFTMLHFEGSSETGLFSHLSNHVFRSP